MKHTGTGSNVIPAVKYRDADQGLAWLKSVLGFAEHAIYRDAATGAVMHAELTISSDAGTGMVMVGTSDGTAELASFHRQPDEVGAVTATVYLMVADCGPVYATAVAAGADILMPLQTMPYGGQSFTVRDLEGHVWSVGEYNPWAIPGSGA